MFRILTFRSLAVICSVLCFILVSAGVLGTVAPVVAATMTPKTKLPVIMYHQISENRSLWGSYVIPQSVLKEDFSYMKENGYTPVSLEALIDYTERAVPLPENPVLITFDDGERSFFTRVLPLLEEYNYPAVISVVGSLIELYSETGDTDDRYAYLNWEDIEVLCTHPLVTLGNHSFGYHSLSVRRGMGRLPGEKQSEYLALMKADILKVQNSVYLHTGMKPMVFAYPYGIRNDALAELISGMGFIASFTCREAVNTLSPGDSLLELARFNRPYGKSSAVFFARYS